MSTYALGTATSFQNYSEYGHSLPNVEVMRGINYNNAQVAEWLPLQVYQDWVRDYYVILPGQPLAFDSQGKLVPAGLALALAASTTLIKYTAVDVAQGVIGANGVAVEVDEPVVDQLETAGITIGNFVGIAIYAAWRNCGGDGINPRRFRKRNYNLQKGITFNMDGIFQLPLVPALTSDEALSESNTVSSTVQSFDALANIPLAGITSRTPFEVSDGNASDSGTVFANRKTALSDVTAAGDYFINTTTGVLYVYATGTIAAADYQVQYYNYDSTTVAANPYAKIAGTIVPGDLVTFDMYSNYIVDSTPSLTDTVGQIVKIETHPVQYLDRVHTNYYKNNISEYEKVPGDATGGVPADVHLAGGADTTVWLNLCTR